MKDKHINIEPDSKLLKLIYATVRKELIIDPKQTTVLLIVKFICYTSFFIVLYVSLFFVQSAGLFIGTYIALGLITILLGFNFAHDLSHNTIFKNKALNNVGFTFLYTLVGAHAEAWKHRHVHSHHYAPNVKDHDPDLQITSLIRVEPSSGYRWFHRYQYWYAPIAYSSYSLYWVFIKDPFIYFTDKTYPKTRTLEFHLCFWLQKMIYLAYILLLPLLFAPQNWSVTLVAFVLMHLIQSIFLLFTFFMTHHVEKTRYYQTDNAGFIQTSWINNQIKSSNDFYPFSKAANFIFGGFNTHIAHHLFPHINHLHYPALSKILYRILQEHHIQPNATGYFEGALSHLRHLKRMGTKPCKRNCTGCPLQKRKIISTFASLPHIK